jgi:hypothetical protein
MRRKCAVRGLGQGRALLYPHVSLEGRFIVAADPVPVLRNALLEVL